MNDGAFCWTKTVDFHETDMAGIVHFANFFKYFEMAETAYFRSIGSSIFDSSQNLRWPRVHVSCDYKAPLRFGDAFEVRLTVAAIKERSAELQFTVRRRDDDEQFVVVAVGRSVIVCAYFDDVEKKIKSQAIPGEIASALAATRQAGAPADD